MLSGNPVEILNQVAETARVRDVAEIVARISGAEVQRVANPRQEDAENELVVANEKFKVRPPLSILQAKRCLLCNVRRRLAVWSVRR